MPCKLMAHFYFLFLFPFTFHFPFFFFHTYLRGFNDFKGRWRVVCLSYFWRKYECSCTLCLFTGYHWATGHFFPGFLNKTSSVYNNANKSDSQ